MNRPKEPHPVTVPELHPVEGRRAHPRHRVHVHPPPGDGHPLLTPQYLLVVHPAERRTQSDPNHLRGLGQRVRDDMPPVLFGVLARQGEQVTGDDLGGGNRVRAYGYFGRFRGVRHMTGCSLWSELSY